MLQKLSLGLHRYKMELPRAELTTCKVTMALSKKAESAVERHFQAEYNERAPLQEEWSFIRVIHY